MVDFTTGIDSTYDVYVFTFTNVRPSINAASFIAVCGAAAVPAGKPRRGSISRALHSIIVSSGATLSSGFTTQGAAILASGVTNGPGTVLGGELRWYAPWRSVQVPMLWDLAYNTGSRCHLQPRRLLLRPQHS